MAATIIQWNVMGLICDRKDFDILINGHQPDVICLQETKLEQNPPLSHYQYANYDCHHKSLRHPDQLQCGGVSIYIKKGLYHKSVQIDSHLQVVAVRITLGGAPITILSVYIPGNNNLTTRDLSHLIRNIKGQILILGDFNGHNYLWSSHDVDNLGEVIERSTNTICLFSMTEPTPIWNPKPSMWTNQHQQ